MEDISNVSIMPLPDSPHLKTFRMVYTQNAREKTWDLLEVHDSVAIILFNVTRKVIILVKEFRPAIYYNLISPADRESNSIDTNKYAPSGAIALELCTGNVRKNVTLEEIAKEVVMNKLGYRVEITDLEKAMSYRAGVGIAGALQTLYYGEVTDCLKTGAGGGVGIELIEIFEMTIPEIDKMMSSRGPLTSPPNCLFALMWFLRNKADRYRKTYERTCGECREPKMVDVYNKTQ